ncbi:MAG: LysE family transporter [Thermochromatium sp.]
MLSFLALGIVLGLSAGLAPGPVLTLVISGTLQHSARVGMKVAIAPLLTDAPLILLTLALLSRLAELDGVLGGLSLAGGGFVSFLGWRTLGTQGVRLDGEVPASPSLTKGMLANLLSPHPYLFWSSVGAPIMAKALVLMYEGGVWLGWIDG